jgi:hypothetical protein
MQSDFSFAPDLASPTKLPDCVNMSDPKIIYSELCTTLELEGRKFRLEITRIKDQAGWTVAVIDETGSSKVLHDLFPTDHAAFAEVTRIVGDEGLLAFHDIGVVVPFPRR